MCMANPKAANNHHNMKRITGGKSVQINENAVDFQEIDVHFGNYLASNDETTPTGKQGTDRKKKTKKKR